MVELAATVVCKQGHQVQLTTMTDEYDVSAELKKHLWADILLQIPVVHSGRSSTIWIRFILPACMALCAMVTAILTLIPPSNTAVMTIGYKIV